jgi:hypothetical protein
MTIGLVLIFLGLQLVIVKSWYLSPTAARFLREDLQGGNRLATGSGNDESLFGGIFESPSGRNNSIAGSPSGQSWPYYRSSQGGNGGSAEWNTGTYRNSSFSSESTAGTSGVVGSGQRIVPPRWVSWPPLFLGIVFFLHGLALRP